MVISIEYLAKALIYKAYNCLNKCQAMTKYRRSKLIKFQNLNWDG